mgnify:FL=1
MRRKKEIELLRSRLASLEAEQEREEKQREALEQCYQQLLTSLQDATLSFEAFVRCFYTDFRKVAVKIERERAKAPQVKTGKPVIRKKTTKKTRRRSARSTKHKNPTARNGNLPDAPPDKVFEVKDKGARPKALKIYAEKVGLENFLKQCLLDKS